MDTTATKRNKQLASARKKLKKFKKKRTNEIENESINNSDDVSSKTSSTLSLQIDNYLEVKQNPESDHSDVVSKTSDNVALPQNSDQFNINSFSDPSNTMENILELSAKLSDIASQAKHLEDKDPIGNGVAEHSTPNKNVVEFKDDSQSKLLQSLQTENKSLNDSINELKSKNKSLSDEIEYKNLEIKSIGQKFQEEKEQLYNYGTKQQNMLQEQIQVQMKTIGVLVAEKQDLHQQTMLLERQLSNVRMQTENSGSEMQNLNKKCLMLQQDLTSQTEANTALEKTIQDLNREKLEERQTSTKLQESLNDAQMQKKELLQKLRMKEMNYTQLNTSYRELQEKFGMAEVLLQQMQAGREIDEDDESSERIDEIGELHRKFEESQHVVTELMVERDRNKMQNEDIRKGMQSQINDLIKQVSALEEERNELLQYQSSLQMQNAEQSNEPVASIKEEIEEAEEKENAASSQLRQQLTQLATAHEGLQHEFNETIRNNEQLSQIIQDKEDQISELTRRLDTMNEEQMGHAKLLEETRGDKTAISRALAQNKQLKLQLEEIQEGFIKLSNDKMDLATQLNTAEHINTDVMKKLNEFEETINMNKTLISDRENEIVQLKSNMKQLQDSLQDKPSDSQNNFLVVQTLQSQLDASQETVNLLREQNTNLKELISKTQSELDSSRNIERELRERLQAFADQAVTVPQQQNAETTKQDVEVGQGVENTNITNEIDGIESQTDAKIQTKLLKAQDTPSTGPSTTVVGNSIEPGATFTTQEEYKILQNNMVLLQDRFTKVMNENAELNNKLEILQHLNTQLENECGTIGEYIALYHDQRQILKQRHREKDEYISSIAREREAMQNKVDQLQSLVLRLLNKEEGNDSDVSNITMDTTRMHNNDVVGAVLESSRVETQEEVASISSDVTDVSDVSAGSNRPNIVGKAKRLSPSSPDGSNMGETAGQIMNLLQEMQKPGDPAMFDPNLIPSGFCMRYKGRYTAI